MICFIHIEKAGGTTIHHILRSNYLSFLSTWPFDKDDYKPYVTSTDLKWLVRLLPFTAGIGGHSLRCYLNYEQFVKDKIDYITFLRDPIKRYISHFNNHKRRAGKYRTIQEFMTEARYDNFMTQRITGDLDIDKAKDFLKNKFSFVGLVENFDESLLLMKNELQLPNLNILYNKRNVSKNPNYQSESIFENHSILKEIEDRNLLDLELYQFVNSEIFPQYYQSYGKNLETDLAQLENEKLDFKFSIVRRLLWVSYRYLVYRNIEYILFKAYHRPKS